MVNRQTRSVSVAFGIVWSVVALILAMVSVAAVKAQADPAPAPAPAGSVQYSPEPFLPGQSEKFNLMNAGPTFGAGWCIDAGLPNPDTNTEGYSVATKLTEVAEGRTADNQNIGVAESLEGPRLDGAVHALELLIKSYREGRPEEAVALNTSLQILLGTEVSRNGKLMNEILEGQSGILTNEKFEEFTGFKLVRAAAGYVYFEKSPAVNLPSAAGKYITVLVPSGYSVRAAAGNPSQRVVPIDQPGLDQPEKPQPTPPAPTPAPAPSPSPQPALKTNAHFLPGNDQVKAGSVVLDTVQYSWLVPGKHYTLNATLVDKQDQNKVVGHGTAELVPVTPTGAQVVTINVDETVTQPVAAAVAFEELTSTEVTREGTESPSGEANLIAEHEDINDAAQTVTSGAAPAPAPAQPEISTVANLENAEGLRVVDTVSFKGLEKGKKYELSGELICKATGKPTGAASKIAFVPTMESGTVKIAIEVTDNGCAEQVAFETLRDVKTGATLAVHHDLEDVAQTVKLDTPEAPKPAPEQGNVTIIDDNSDMRTPDTGAHPHPEQPRVPIDSIPSGPTHLIDGMSEVVQ